jgi:molybdopterin molybdotransferase
MMIGVSEAKRLLASTVRPLGTGSRPLLESVGYVNAKPISARFDSPRFDQSAVDGYALFGKGAMKKGLLEFAVKGEMKAGGTPLRKAASGTALRIFTGAAVPAGAECVVMQEQVEVHGSSIHVRPDLIKAGANIRRRGNHFRKGQEILSAGMLIGPAAVGLLASQGYTAAKVHARPGICILVTGDELVPLGEKLPAGGIFESNSQVLTAALLQYGFPVEAVRRCGDDRNQLRKTMALLLDKCDTLVVTGGISVGKYDLVKPTLESLGVRELFHKVAQKPGKPLYAGTKGKKLVFALPGNPAAVLVCFMQYVLPSLRIQSGNSKGFPEGEVLPLGHDLQLKGDRDQFLRGRLSGGRIVIGTAQDSDNLLSFAQSDRLVYLPSGSTSMKEGEPVVTFPFWR